MIPSYDYSGEEESKAPMLQGRRENHILPDLDCANSVHRRWVEVKAKTVATTHRITGRVEHGIQLRHFKSYKRVQEITGSTVWLAIAEADTGAILVGELDRLHENARVYDGPKMGRGGMIFFLRSDFKVLAEKAKDSS